MERKRQQTHEGNIRAAFGHWLERPLGGRFDRGRGEQRMPTDHMRAHNFAFGIHNHGDKNLPPDNDKILGTQEWRGWLTSTSFVLVKTTLPSRLICATVWMCRRNLQRPLATVVDRARSKQSTAEGSTTRRQV